MNDGTRQNRRGSLAVATRQRQCAATCTVILHNACAADVIADRRCVGPLIKQRTVINNRGAGTQAASVRAGINLQCCPRVDGGIAGVVIGSGQN